jgi:hypothetical protein
VKVQTIFNVLHQVIDESLIAWVVSLVHFQIEAVVLLSLPSLALVVFQENTVVTTVNFVVWCGWVSEQWGF